MCINTTSAVPFHPLGARSLFRATELPKRRKGKKCRCAWQKWHCTCICSAYASMKIEHFILQPVEGFICSYIAKILSQAQFSSCLQESTPKTTMKNDFIVQESRTSLGHQMILWWDAGLSLKGRAIYNPTMTMLNTSHYTCLCICNILALQMVHTCLYHMPSHTHKYFLISQVKFEAVIILYFSCCQQILLKTKPNTVLQKSKDTERLSVAFSLCSY